MVSILDVSAVAGCGGALNRSTHEGESTGLWIVSAVNKDRWMTRRKKKRGLGAEKGNKDGERSR